MAHRADGLNDIFEHDVTVKETLFAKWLSGNGDGINFSLTNGSVLFAENNKIAQDNSNIFWDNVNNILKVPKIEFNDDDSTPAYISSDGSDGLGIISSAGDIAIAALGTLNLGGATNGTSVIGDFLVDTDTFFVDAGDNRVGIGTATPEVSLDVVGHTRVYNGEFRLVNNGDSILRFSDSGGAYMLYNNSSWTNYSYTRPMLFTSYNNTLTFNAAFAASGLTKEIYFQQGQVNSMYLDTDRNLIIEGDVGIKTTTPDTKLQIVGDFKTGQDTTNYATFKGDGELNLYGTARVKKEFGVMLSDFNPGASGPTAALHDIFSTYEFTLGDDMHTSFELPTDWEAGTDLEIEVYWAIDEAYADNSGEVRWSADWRAVAVGELIGAGASGTCDFGDVDIPATANTVVKTECSISGASLAQDDLIAFNGSRVALVAGSNPTAEPYIVAIRVEYIANKLGEAL